MYILYICLIQLSFLNIRSVKNEFKKVDTEGDNHAVILHNIRYPLTFNIIQEYNSLNF